MHAGQFTPHQLQRQSFGALYQQIGVETAVGSATPHQLVCLLFDGFLEAVAQARGAMRDGHIEIKCTAIGRAVRIVEEGLRAGLDRRAGGKLAADLDELYRYLCLRLTMANLRNDDLALQEAARLMQPLRDAWLAIAPQADRR